MVLNTNPWDSLAKNFDAHQPKGAIDPRVADNILLAWPPMLTCITKQFSNPRGRTALDYGCGTGAFCARLEQLGFAVTGIDLSPEMIRITKTASPKAITHIVGDHTALPQGKIYDVIASIMTFPFIQDIDAVVAALAKALNKHGVFCVCSV